MGVRRTRTLVHALRELEPLIGGLDASLELRATGDGHFEATLVPKRGRPIAAQAAHAGRAIVALQVEVEALLVPPAPRQDT